MKQSHEVEGSHFVSTCCLSSGPASLSTAHLERTLGRTRHGCLGPQPSKLCINMGSWLCCCYGDYARNRLEIMSMAMGGGRKRQDACRLQSWWVPCQEANYWMIPDLFFSHTQASNVRNWESLRLFLHLRAWATGCFVRGGQYLEARPLSPFIALHHPLFLLFLLWACLWTAVAGVILMKCDICRLWPPTKESELWNPMFYELQNKSWPAFIACSNCLSQVS